MARHSLGRFLLAMALLASGASSKASEALNRTVLPIPQPAFQGRIGPTVERSTADFPRPVQAPAGAPNVLIILLDDVGFGHASTFGGAVATPTMESLARQGLKYNTFHTTALCSPTRAALLTGRNHHSVGSGVVVEMGTGFPGYTGIVPNSTASLPSILRHNGYTTAAFGKWHNTPDKEISPAGPFDRWPTGRTWGFDTFYGFMNGETHQYYPVLYRNTTPVAIPRTPEQGYHITNDLVDEAIGWLHQVNAADPRKPWLLYFSTGAVHAPHHTPQAFIDQYKGRFNSGWDVYRQQTFERQKRMGVIPATTTLTPRPPEIPSWASQPQEARTVYSRLMENYSGFLEHTDRQIGRLIEALRQSGELENTLIVTIVGDNGASAEGGLEGTINETASVNGIQLGLKELSSRIDQIGGPRSDPHVPVGWAWAANTPFQWAKQIASHLGGTRNGLIIQWPRGIQARNEGRSQFHHVIDIAPTVLEAAGIPQPTSVDGIPQKPIEGVSMLYSFDKQQAPSRRTLQYFEMLGNRGIYKDGWLASARHGRLPWETGAPRGQFDRDPWELYNLNQDFSQAVNLADRYPDQLNALKAAFEVEAQKYNVYPLDDRLAQRFDTTLRPNPLVGMKRIAYRSGVTGLSEAAVLNTHNVAFNLSADVVIDKPGTQGVLAAMGGSIAGWSFYLENGKPTFLYNYFDIEHTRLQAHEPLPTGAATIEVEVRPVEPGPGKPANVRLLVNHKSVASGRVNRTVPYRFGVEPFDIGADTVSPVSADYASPNRFTGTIRQVVLEVP